MPRHVLSIKDLGEETCQLLVRQAVGIPDAKARSDFMLGRTAVLIFAEFALGERLCVTAAARHMGGYVVYEGPDGGWRKGIDEYRRQVLPIFEYYVDCMYTYGLPTTPWGIDVAGVNFPVINAGSPEAHPAHALADIVCMLRESKDVRGATAAWIGCANGALYSLITAAAFFSFTLRVCLPAHFDAAPAKALAAEMKSHVIFVESPVDAVKGAGYVFAGCRGDIEDADAWRIDANLMAKAATDARLLLSTAPIATIRVDKDVLSSPVSCLVQQAECRLRIHKRILHWIFQESERIIQY